MFKVSQDSQNQSQNCENAVNNLPHIDRPVTMKIICK